MVWFDAFVEHTNIIISHLHNHINAYFNNIMFHYMICSLLILFEFLKMISIEHNLTNDYR
jgi:hypothetical protein